MTQYPVFLNLKSQPVLLVGAGKAATVKAREMLKAGAELFVVAPEICRQMVLLAERHPEQVFVDEVAFDHDKYGALGPFRIIVVATGNQLVNEQARRVAEVQNSLFLDVSQASSGNYTTPAVIQRGKVQLAIATGGVPVLARVMRQTLERVIPDNLGVLASLMAWFRKRLKTSQLNRLEQRRFQEHLCTHEFLETLGEHHDTLSESMVLTEFENWNSRRNVQSPDSLKSPGKVYLVGGGPGDPGMLTLRAHEVIQQADVILHDQLVSDEVLALARRDADRIAVGKSAGGHATEQTYINRMLVKLAYQGKRVVRLKGGDPFIYGRGGEEMLHLVRDDVPYEVVPGITAAVGVSATCGIPLTHRDLAHSFTLVSGHLKDDQEPDWKALARDSQTLVFYMGLSRAKRISQVLISRGRPANTPVAIVERGTTPDQRVVTGVLSSLDTLVRQHQIETPALLIVGDVVNVYHEINESGVSEVSTSAIKGISNVHSIHAA